MTDEQQKVLTNFETRVRQLMLLCDSLRQEKANLEETLKAQGTALKEALESIQDLKTRYDNLKLAKMIAPGESDVQAAQQRLSKLVREIDKCIALINE